ncbi:MAG: multiprotein bridging factor aMBF1 [Candidatus Bathyarchaeia archaeon]
MQCEVCGYQIAGKPQRVIIEGAKMITCEKCAKLGSTHWEPERASTKKETKLVARNTLLRRKTFLNPPENLEIVEGFGSSLRQAREKLGLSYEDLGRKISEKVSVIKKIESEKIVPDQKLAAKLENILRVKLFVPAVETEAMLKVPPPTAGVTVGEIIHLKNGKREASKERRRS